MEQNSVVESVVAWLPLIIILGLWFYAMRRYKGSTNEVMDMNREIISMNREIQALNQTMSDTLLRIEKVLQNRNA
jgi:ATP-dependent Zn protease